MRKLRNESKSEEQLINLLRSVIRAMVILTIVPATDTGNGANYPSGHWVVKVMLLALADGERYAVKKDLVWDRFLNEIFIPHLAICNE